LLIQTLSEVAELMEMREWNWLFVTGWHVQERDFFSDGFFKLVTRCWSSLMVF